MVYENPLPLITDFTDHFSYLIFSLIMIALSIGIILSVVLEHRHTQWYQVADDEYNFMAQPESEQSRLDLAQAFLDIGKNTEAKDILEELLSSHNPIIKEHTKQLLNRY